MADMRAVLTLILCIGYVGYGFALPEPIWLSGNFGSRTDIADNLVDFQGLDPFNQKSSFRKTSTLQQGISNVLFPKFNNKNIFKMGGIFGNVQVSRPQIYPLYLQKDILILMRKLKEKVDNIAAEIRTLVRADGRAIVSDLKEKIESITNEIKSLADGEDVNKIKENLLVTREKLEDWADNVMAILENQSGKPISEQLNRISTEMAPILSELGKIFGGEEGELIMSDIGSHISNILNEIATILSGDSVSEIVSKIEEIRDTFNNAMNEIGDVLQEKRPLDETIRQVGEKIQNSLSNIGNVIGGEDYKKIMEDIGEKINNILDKVSSTVSSESVQKITSAAVNIGNQLGEAMELLKSFVNKVNNKDIMQLVDRRRSANVKLLLTQYRDLITRIINNNPALRTLFAKLSPYFKISY